LILFLDKNVENSGFIVGFLTCLHDASEEDRIVKALKEMESWRLPLRKYMLDELRRPVVEFPDLVSYYRCVFTHHDMIVCEPSTMTLISIYSVV